ncbi:N-acetylmuramoyl-L-alanine amidase [Halobacillus sp. BBL2006]|uniref:N-acetylmuramoyl-L-alanine amidase n=1 Tax=Halobacillus sp. BBL2006 TaxID=1543706 RepID=UPI0006898C37|nr:N-acetylmuramoyl-L-alanine amidase [Halobacillus sp. BBL2006]
MPKLIALDDGHGMETLGKRTPVIPELGRSIRENEFNRAVVNFLKQELERCGFDTLLVAPTDEDISLQKRTDLANARKADIYVAVHYNAYDGSFSGQNPSGIEIYVYNGDLNRESGKLATAVGKYLRQGTKQNWRGIKEANFYVLRETNMPAILTENGFMDNKQEALLMIDEDFQREVAVEHAKGICEYFNVPYISASDNAAQTGFRDVSPDAYYANAVKRAKDLGLLNGYPDGRFLPDNSLTRKDFAVALMRLYDKLK